MGKNRATMRRWTGKSPQIDEKAPKPDPIWTVGRVSFWIIVCILVSLLYYEFYVLLHADSDDCNLYDLQCD
ncbi:GL12880 [Drosophila persimilis]|uniref:GL12880 n=1 Tax=Drosophila persimilis TaxID=7234 RepID=B4GVA2_DROPE|nr:GL12880 [Drosophila persimilis]